VYISVLRS